MMSAIVAYNIVYWLLYWTLDGCYLFSYRQVLNQTLKLHLEIFLIVGYPRQNLESDGRLCYGTFLVKRHCSCQQHPVNALLFHIHTLCSIEYAENLRLYGPRALSINLELQSKLTLPCV